MRDATWPTQSRLTSWAGNAHPRPRRQRQLALLGMHDAVVVPVDEQGGWRPGVHVRQRAGVVVEGGNRGVDRSQQAGLGAGVRRRCHTNRRWDSKRGQTLAPPLDESEVPA